MSRALAQARRLFEAFTGRPVDREELIRAPKVPEAVACIGEIVAVEYVADRDGDVAIFRHVFKEKSRPLMCVFPDGSKVLMLGGAWKFTEDGYIDD